MINIIVMWCWTSLINVSRNISHSGFVAYFKFEVRWHSFLTCCVLEYSICNWISFVPLIERCITTRGRASCDWEVSSCTASDNCCHIRYRVAASILKITYIQYVFIQNCSLGNNDWLYRNYFPAGWSWIIISVCSNLFDSTIYYLVQVGFKSTRYYWSYRQMNKRCRYICKIEDQNGMPEFVVTVMERGMEQVVLRNSSCKGSISIFENWNSWYCLSQLLISAFILIHDLHSFWFTICIHFDSRSAFILIHVLHSFWFTFCIHFDSRSAFISIHDLHSFWFTICIHFDSRSAFILIHVLHSFWFTFCIHFDSRSAFISIHDLHSFWFTICIHFDSRSAFILIHDLNRDVELQAWIFEPYFIILKIYGTMFSFRSKRCDVRMISSRCFLVIWREKICSAWRNSLYWRSLNRWKSSVYFTLNSFIPFFEGCNVQLLKIDDVNML